MGHSKVGRWALGLCMGLGLLWAGEIYWYLQAPTALPAPGPVADTHPAAVAALPLRQLPPLGQYQAISLRPLFHPNRQPEAVATPAPTQASVDLQATLKLKGIFLKGTQRVALFESVASQQTRQVREGESLGDWRLDALSPDAAEFSQGAAKIRFELRAGSESAPKTNLQPVVSGVVPSTRQEKRRNHLESRQQ